MRIVAETAVIQQMIRDSNHNKNKWSEVTQSCLTLCDPMDCSLPGSSIHGIFQARVLEGVAISFSRRSSQPRGWTQVSCIVGRHFTIWATREVTHNKNKYGVNNSSSNSRITSHGRGIFIFALND